MNKKLIASAMALSVLTPVAVAPMVASADVLVMFPTTNEFGSASVVSGVSANGDVGKSDIVLRVNFKKPANEGSNMTYKVSAHTVAGDSMMGASSGGTKEVTGDSTFDLRVGKDKIMNLDNLGLVVNVVSYKDGQPYGDEYMYADYITNTEYQKPEIGKPETEKPETEKPEVEKPETEKPETEKPETEKPETENGGSDKDEGTGSDKDESDKDEGNGSDKDESDKDEGTGSDIDESDKDEGNGSDKDESDKNEGTGSDKDETDKDESDKNEGTGSDKDENDENADKGKTLEELKEQLRDKVNTTLTSSEAKKIADEDETLIFSDGKIMSHIAVVSDVDTKGKTCEDLDGTKLGDPQYNTMLDTTRDGVISCETDGTGNVQIENGVDENGEVLPQTNSKTSIFTTIFGGVLVGIAGFFGLREKNKRESSSNIF